MPPPCEPEADALQLSVADAPQLSVSSGLHRCRGRRPAAVGTWQPSTSPAGRRCRGRRPLLLPTIHGSIDAHVIVCAIRVLLWHNVDILQLTDLAVELLDVNEALLALLGTTNHPDQILIVFFNGRMVASLSSKNLLTLRIENLQAFLQVNDLRWGVVGVGFVEAKEMLLIRRLSLVAAL